VPKNPEAAFHSAEDALNLSRSPAVFKDDDKKPILEMDQAFQVKPQWPHVVGLRPASNESRPTGKKQILTTIAHVG
jgi:hypothetical protein